MKYERTIIDGSVFGLTNAQFSRLPELPMLEYKAGKWKIKITDLRCLNEQAVRTFEQCVLVAAKEKGATEAAFLIGDVCEDKLKLIIDICMAVNFEAKRRGGDYIGGSFLIIGAERRDNVIAFRFTPRMARAIYDYVQERHVESGEIRISLLEIIAQIVEKEYTETAQIMHGSKPV